MKKLLSLTLAVVLLLGLSGCAATAPSPDTRPSETVAAETVSITAPPETIGWTEDTQPPATTVPDITEATDPPKATEATEEQDEHEEMPIQQSQQESEPTEPAPTTEPTQPPTTEPTVPSQTEPPTTEPPTTEPPTTLPPETLPLETEPPEKEPATEATDPPAEVIDTAALEAYGRSYAASTYGYEGNVNCDPSTNAGYFPGVTRVIRTMEDGYAAAREAVDYQYASDISMGRTICAEIDGVLQRRNINLYFQPTDDPNVFIVWCYYGGEA